MVDATTEYWKKIGEQVAAKKRKRLVSRICKTCGVTIVCNIWNAPKLCKVCTTHKCGACQKKFYGPPGNCPECRRIAT